MTKKTENQPDLFHAVTTSAPEMIVTDRQALDAVMMLSRYMLQRTAASAPAPAPAPAPSPPATLLESITNQVNDRGGRWEEVRSKEIAAAIGGNVRRIAQLLKSEMNRPTGCLTVSFGKSDRLAWSLSSSPAHAAHPLTQKEPRTAQDRMWNGYLARVAERVSKRPSKSESWTVADIAKNVHGRPGSNNRGLSTVLRTMAGQGIVRAGLMASLESASGDLYTYRLTAV